MAKEKFYRIQIDAKAKAPELKMKNVKLEKLSAEQKKEFEETRTGNKGRAAWLMPSGSIFWTSAGTEINNAKKIVFKENAAKAKKNKKAKGKKTKAKTRRKK